MEIKKNLIEEIRNSIEGKIKDDYKRMKSQEEKFNKYKQVFISQGEKLKMHITKKFENEKTIQILFEELQSDLISKRNLLDNLGDKNLTKENCFEFVNVKNPENKFIEILSMEACIEDMHLITKRAFEKGVIDFNETLRFIRSLSKEAVKVKFLRDGIRRKYEKNFY